MAVLHGTATAEWMMADASPLVSDEPQQVILGAWFWMWLRGLSEGYFGPTPAPGNYPPLTYAVTSVFFEVGGTTTDAAQFSIWPFGLLFLLGCWWAGREVGGRGGGAAVLLAAAGSPWVAVYSRSYLVDMPVAAMVALALAALLSSANLTRPLPTLVLGTFLGLGMLAKWIVPVFMAIPVAWCALPALRRGGGRGMAVLTLLCLALTAGFLQERMTAYFAFRWGGHGFPWRTFLSLGLTWVAVLTLVLRESRTRRRWSSGTGLAAAVSLSVLICLPWYVANLGPMAGKILYEVRQEQHFWLHLGTSLWLMQRNGIAAGWWALNGLAVGLLVRELRGPTGMMVVSLLGSVVILLQAAGPAMRYLLPALPFLLVLSFAWTGRMLEAGRPPLARALAGLVLAILAVGAPLQLGLVPVPRPLRADVVDIGHRPASNPWKLTSPDLVPVVQPPLDEPYPFAETVEELRRRGIRRVQVYTHEAVLHPHVPNMDNFAMHAMLRRLPLQVEVVPWPPARMPDAHFRAVLVMAPVRPLDDVRRQIPWLEEWRPAGSWSGGDDLAWWLLMSPGDPAPAR